MGLQIIKNQKEHALKELAIGLKAQGLDIPEGDPEEIKGWFTNSDDKPQLAEVR